MKIYGKRLRRLVILVSSSTKGANSHYWYFVIYHAKAPLAYSEGVMPTTRLKVRLKLLLSS